jgi:hypothetical protein
MQYPVSGWPPSMLGHIKGRTFFLSVAAFFLLVPSLLAQQCSVDADTVQRRGTMVKMAGYTAAYYGGSMYILGKTWYRGKEKVPFHWYNDNRGWLQVDKLGHAYGSYVYSYAGYHAFLHAGFSRKEALWYGATLGFILQAPIEIMDGIHQRYGFSVGDLMANFMGSAMVFGQELVFKEQVVRFKFSYHETGYSRRANGFLGTTSLNRILKDYNGHAYWLSVPLNTFIKNDVFPAWLSISAGYGAKGMMGEFENISEYKGVPFPETTRYRQFLISPDIEWTKIKTGSQFLKAAFTAMSFVKFPLPTLELNSKSEWRGYWLYF